MSLRVTLLLPALLVLVVSGCRDKEIRTYRIAKEPVETPAPAQQAMAPGANTARPPIRWEKPEAWQDKPGNTMRVGSFTVPGTHGHAVDMAITTFPGDVGGDLANVNRWRGQIQLPEIGAADLNNAITQLDLPAGRFLLVDLVSDQELMEDHHKARILGAWFKQPERTWFFKMVGDDDAVGAQKDTFLAFLKTVTFDAEAAAKPADTNSLPERTASAADVPPPPSEATLQWTAPADWKPKPLGQMRKGSYSLPAADGSDSDLSITSLSAGANPLLDNINRWRRQIGLGPLTESDIPAQTTTVKQGGLQFTVVDYANNAARVIGAIVYVGDEAWFFKLSGADAAVAQRKPAFLDFLKTVKTR